MTIECSATTRVWPSADDGGPPKPPSGSTVVGDREVDGVAVARDRAVDDDGGAARGREVRRDVAGRRDLTGEPDRLRHGRRTATFVRAGEGRLRVKGDRAARVNDEPQVLRHRAGERADVLARVELL